MDRNTDNMGGVEGDMTSLSARRAWIEISFVKSFFVAINVALRKESVDRNRCPMVEEVIRKVALRKESVDRNSFPFVSCSSPLVALRKESVDRNFLALCRVFIFAVALHKESVDRNPYKRGQGEN